MDFLVIDDDKTFREATCLLIDSEGHYAEAASSGAMGLTEIKEGKRNYHFVEVMTCPGGCIGGGGQPYPQGITDPLDHTLYNKRGAGLYSIDEKKSLRKSHENPQITKIYKEFLKEPLGEMSHKLLHTHYHPKPPVAAKSA